jgi:hypothetical protein
MEHVWTCLYGAVILVGFVASLHVFLRWVRRPGPAERVPDSGAVILRHNNRLRFAMVASAVIWTSVFALFLYDEALSGPQQGDEDCARGPVATCFCFAVFGFFLLLSLYGSLGAFQHKVILSDHGLKIHRPLLRCVEYAWKDIAEVTYSSHLEVFRVRTKGGSVKWISSDLGGMDLFHEYLDHHLWPADPAAVPTYLAALKHRNCYVRRGGAVGLCKIGPAARSALPDLTRLLQDRDVAVRSWSALALGQLGPEARLSVPALLGAVRDKDPDVRLSAAEALWLVKGQNELSLPVFLFCGTPCGTRTSTSAVELLRFWAAWVRKRGRPS